MTSRAQLLFRQILDHSDPVTILHSFINHRTETEFIEFKGAGKIQPKQVKELWSQTISAFANTEGGILIWGIRASRIEHPDDPSRKIDIAAEVDPVANTPIFAQLLKDVLLEACVDPVPGIEICSLGPEQAGFVVCFIPEGRHKPYRATLDPAKQYFQRIADNSVVIPHSLLRSLFYPHVKSLLCINAVPTKASFNNENEDRILTIALRNRGAATATDICAVVDYPFTSGFAWDSIWIPRGETKDGRRRMVCGMPLHPGEEHPVGQLKMVRRPADGSTSILYSGFTSEFRFFSTNAEPQVVEINFNPGELNRYLTEKEFIPSENVGHMCELA